MAQILDPVIHELHKSGAISKNLVLLMLLREFLGGWIGQNEISDIHTAWFAKFTFGDLAIPYNCMFDQNMFRKIATISNGFFFECHGKSLYRLSFYHIVFLEWLSQQDAPIIGKGVEFVHWLKENKDELSNSPLDLAAAKSLVVRHWPVDHPLDVSNSDKLGADFLEFATDVISRRERLHRAIRSESVTISVRGSSTIEIGRRSRRQRISLSASFLPFGVRRGERKLQSVFRVNFVVIRGRFRPGRAPSCAMWTTTSLSIAGRLLAVPVQSHFVTYCPLKGSGS